MSGLFGGFFCYHQYYKYKIHLLKNLPSPFENLFTPNNKYIIQNLSFKKDTEQCFWVILLWKILNKISINIM